MSQKSSSTVLALPTIPGFAWIVLTLALALHVLDEAVHDFLSFYNPAALAVRDRLPFLPLPTFSFGAWLAGLIAGVVLLSLLSPFAFRRAVWLRPLALLLSIFMMVNAGIHIFGSLFLGSVMPGTYSAPVLLAAAVCLLVSALRYWKVPVSSEGEL